MNDSQVLDLLEQKLADIPKNGVRLNLNREATQRKGRWIYAVVDSDPADVRLSKFNALARPIEEELEEEADTFVLLVPALVD